MRPHSFAVAVAVAAAAFTATGGPAVAAHATPIDSATVRAEGPLESAVDQAIANPHVLDNYIKCFLDTGKCDPVAKELKRVLPDALRTGCAKCTDDQARATTKLIDHLRTHRPVEWLLIEIRYLPTPV